ncbi:leucine-rich repeat protein [Lachnospiraceae bacterium 47-T17]
MGDNGKLNNINAFGTAVPKNSTDDQSTVVREPAKSELGYIDAFAKVSETREINNAKEDKIQKNSALEAELNIFSSHTEQLQDNGALYTIKDGDGEHPRAVQENEESVLSLKDFDRPKVGNEADNDFLAASVKDICSSNQGSQKYATDVDSEDNSTQDLQTMVNISKSLQEEVETAELEGKLEQYADRYVNDSVNDRVNQDVAAAKKKFFNFSESPTEDDVSDQFQSISDSDFAEGVYEDTENEQPLLKADEEEYDPFAKTVSKRIACGMSRIPEFVDRICTMDTADTITAIKNGCSHIGAFLSDKVDRVFDFNKNLKLDKIFENGDLVRAADFEFLRNGNDLMLYRYNGISTRLVVPSHVANLPVRYIHSDFVYRNYFSNYKSRGKKNIYSAENIATASRELKKALRDGIEEIVLPNTLRSIPGKCFLGCAKMHSIVVPESVVYLAANAFNLSEIKDIYFNGPCPSGITLYSLKGCVIHVREEYLDTFRELRR